MKDYVTKAYFQRFGKNEGVDAWMATTTAKPFVDPTTPVTPISDPDPVKTTTTTSGAAVAGSPAAATTTTTTTTTTTAKPAAATPVKTGTTVAKKPGVK